MEGPGMSLFQGAPSIHINNSVQDRLEEEEELADRQRREEELKRELENGFNDLTDIDEASSVNSSGNFTLDSAHANDAQLRTRMPPTYDESVTLLKDQDAPKPYFETPYNNNRLKCHEDVHKNPCSPYGAGDGQNVYLQQEFRGHLNGVDNFDVRKECINNDLKVMYEMRVKECQQLAGQVGHMEKEVESLRARLMAANNDKDKAELSIQEAHNLLATNKHKLFEMEQKMSLLSEKLAHNEMEKEQLRMELRSANMSLQETQQRMHTLQVEHTHGADALFRQQQDRHREEMDRLQNDSVKVKNRLEEKEREIKILEKRCKEKEKEKEGIIIEKGDIINQLASQLEAAQKRIVSGEANKLKEKVSQLTAERNTAKEQVKELGSKLQNTAQELVICRNKLNANQIEYNNWQSALHQIISEALPENHYGEPPSPGKLSGLKEVLSHYKIEMQKISTLQEEISKRDKKLEQHRKQESELRSKVEEYKGIEMQLNSRVAVLQNKIELLGSSSDSELLEKYKEQNERLQHELEEVRGERKQLDLKYAELEMEHDKLKSEKGGRASIVQKANAELLSELDKQGSNLRDTLRQNGELKALYLQACSSRDAVTRELKDLHTKIQKEKEMFKTQEREYIEIIEREKQQVVKISSELTVAKTELDAANKRISELHKDFTDKQKEFNEKLDQYLQDEKNALRNEMQQCDQCDKHLKRIHQLDEQLSKCSLKLATQGSNEELMQQLRGKAQFFQEYIMERFQKLSEQRCVATNTDPEAFSPMPSNNNTDSDNALDARTALMMKEKAIRDQIAEKFTLEMKTVEMNCARRIKEMENDHLGAITKLKELLERKAKEVETLKEFILSERSKVTQILEAKENEISVLIKEHNELQMECQKNRDHVLEWRLKAEKYKDKLSKLGSLEDVLKNERERNSSCAKECQAVKSKLAEILSKNSQLERKYEKLQVEHTTLQEKYKNVKKTVFTYKDYMAKKDTHVSNEMNRIQDEYRKIFIKLQNQINHHVNCRIQEERSNGKPAEAQQYQQSDYSDKIKKLNEDFARLAQSQFKEIQDSN